MTNRVRTPLREIELRAFWASTTPLRVLAEKWHCTTACLSVWARELGLPSRVNRMYQIRCNGVLYPKGDSYVQHAAECRGMTVAELEHHLIMTVIENRLIEAVLDDADETRSAA